MGVSDTGVVNDKVVPPVFFADIIDVVGLVVVVGICVYI